MTKRKIVVTTALVLAAIAVMTRLGVWQLDRLVQRRAFNAQVAGQLQAAPLTDLTGLGDLSGVSYRAVVVRGEYDFTQQVALSNQDWQDQPGVHLITPLVIAGTDQAVFVDRGWIPYQESTPANWSKFAEPGVIEIHGRIRPTQTSVIPVAPPTTRQDSWFRVDVAALQTQVSHPLLPIYIQQSPKPNSKELPYRSELDMDLSEGPHIGYALTWFALAAILGIGYAGYMLKPRAKSLRVMQITPKGDRYFRVIRG